MKEDYIRVSFLVMMVVLVLISYLTYHNLDNYIVEVKMVRHSNRVLTGVQNVLSSVKDAETGCRGFELTRDSTYLIPYFNSLKDLPGELKILDSLLSQNRAQSSKADTLIVLVENQYLIMSQLLSNASRSSLYMDRYESSLLGRGKANMDAIRQVAGRITGEEEKIYEDRISMETRYRKTAPVVLFLLTLVALVGMTFLFIRILEALSNRRIAEDQLKDNVEELSKEATIRRFTEKTLKNVLDNSLDAIMAFRSIRNAEGQVEDFEWIMVNSIGSTLAGQSEQTLSGERMREMMPEIGGDDLFQIYVEVVSSGRSRQFEKILQRDNTSTWFRITVVKLEDGFVVTFSDITTQKKAEKDMLIAERLSMTGKIARTIAHEVRNPLTSLTLALEQLRDELPKNNKSVDECCDIIERNANRIEQLIGEMLNSSKPRELALELTSIEEVIDETINLTNDRINLNQIRLERRYTGGLPRILLDREKMKIAFLNIIVNAVEAMEAGKGVLRIDTKKENGSVVVSISDNGKGIAPQDIERLFDPFFTGKQGGMGLGLTTTKNILSSHSATIDVYSALSEGTTFCIYFKLAAA